MTMISSCKQNSSWCIVVADDDMRDWLPDPHGAQRHVPVQYGCLGGASSLLHRAFCRAAKLARDDQIIVSALEEYRDFWEPATWFIPPRNKFIGDNRAAALLSTTAAVLSIAAKNPTNIVAILPARCHVDHESNLHEALSRGIALLPFVDESVITLGMTDPYDGIDEDYLVVAPSKPGPGFEIDGYACRPVPWVARHLKERGAMVASGIMVGYAGAFAAHISGHWPGISRKLMTITAAAVVAGTECEVSMDLQHGVPSAVVRSLRWRAPSFAQRALPVNHCGWSGLKSAQAIEHINKFVVRTRAVDTDIALASQTVRSLNVDPWVCHNV